MTCAWISHPSLRLHEMGEGHPECPERLDAISDHLLSTGLMNLLVPFEAPAATEELQRMLDSPGAIADIARTVDDSLRALRVRELDERSAASQRAMRAAVNDEERNHLMREIHDISKERRALDAARTAPSGKSPGGGSSNS